MFAGLIPSPGPARTLAVATLIRTIGSGAFVTCSALYFTRIVGLSAAQVGLGLSLAGGVRLFAGVPLGHLADRRGAREVAAGLAGLIALAMASYLVVRSFLPFVLVACAYAVLDGGYHAARQALLAAVIEGEALVKTRAQLRAITNVGFSLGAGLGGLALIVDRPAAYLATIGWNSAAILATSAFLLRMPRVPPAPPAAAGEPRLAVLRDRAFATVTGINALIFVHYAILDVAMPLWIVTHTDAPRVLVAVLVLVNTGTVVLAQVRLSARIATLQTAVPAFRFSGLVLAAACLTFAASSWTGALAAAALLVVAGFVHVYGEMLQAAASWVIAYELAPADKQGQYQGMFTTGFAAAEMLAPALLILLVIEWGTPGWFLLAAVFIAAGLAMAPAVRWASRTRPVLSSAMPTALVGAGAEA